MAELKLAPPASPVRRHQPLVIVLLAMGVGILADRWLRPGVTAEISVAALSLLGWASSWLAGRERTAVVPLTIAVAWYGLILSLMHFGIVSLTRAHRAEIPPSLSRRILGSLRIVAGYVLFAVLLTIVDRQLGAIGG